MKSSDNVLRGELVGVFGLQVDDEVSQYALFTEATVPGFAAQFRRFGLAASYTC